MKSSAKVSQFDQKLLDMLDATKRGMQCRRYLGEGWTQGESGSVA